MDITPRLSADALVIRNYGPAGFTIADQLHPNAVLITADNVVDYPTLTQMENTPWADIIPHLQAAKTELLLVGSGDHMWPMDDAVKAQLRALAISSEAMDTGAAARTYNVLFGEERRVAVLLLPVSRK